MSKLDFVTIAIFVVCIAAIIFLIVKTTQLINGSEAPGIDRSTIEDARSAPAQDDYYAPPADAAGQFQPYRPDEEDASVDVYDPVGDDARFEQPATSPSSSSVSTASRRGGRYIVIAGSFRQRANAETQVRKLKSLGYADAEVGTTNRGAFAVAVVGRFDNVDQARALVRELGTQYQIEAMVKQ